MTDPPGKKPSSQSHVLEEVFVLTALLSLAASTGYLCARPELLQGHFYRLPLFAVTHVFTTGWIVLMASGVLVRLAPRVWGTPPGRAGLGFTFYGLWVVGAAGLVMHMARGEWFGVWTSAVLSLLAVLLLFPLHRPVWPLSRRGDWIARYALAAVTNLVLAVAAGLFIGLNRHLNWVPLPTYGMLAVHFHLALAGFVTMLIFGFGRRLQPTLAPSRSRERWETPLRFWTLEAGLLALTAALVVLPPAVPAAAIVVAGSIWLHAARPVHRLLTGRVTDPATFWVSVALLMLAVTAVLGLVLAFSGVPADPILRDRIRFAYGFLGLTGWVTLAMTSFAHKLFPLWVWEERFGADLGKRPVPSMRRLHSTTVLHASGLAQTAGSVAAVLGILLDRDPLAAWGFRIFTVGILLFGVNFFLMARWSLLRRQYTPSPEDRQRFEEVYGPGSSHR